VRRAVNLLLGALVVAGVVTSSRRAGAEERALFELESESSADARTCADVSVLRAKVAERLGRDPFTTGADARGKLRVAFARDKGRTWTADIALADATGKRIGARALTHTGGTCEPLVGSVVFTIAVLIEDLAPPQPEPTAPVAPPPPPPALPPIAPSADAPAAPPPAASPRTMRFDASIGAVGALGGAPAPTGGGEILVGLDVARLRVELSGRVYAPASSDGDVAVRTRLVHGRVAPCYGWVVLAGCVVAAVGSVSGEATGDGVVSSRLAGQVYAATGVGLLSRVFVVDDLLFIRASVDLLLAVTRAGFDVGERRVWTVPFASAASTISFGVRLP
jgi:hypothetical protein